MNDSIFIKINSHWQNLWQNLYFCKTEITRIGNKFIATLQTYDKMNFTACNNNKTT